MNKNKITKGVKEWHNISVVGFCFLIAILYVVFMVGYTIFSINAKQEICDQTLVDGLCIGIKSPDGLIESVSTFLIKAVSWLTVASIGIFILIDSVVKIMDKYWWE